MAESSEVAKIMRRKIGKEDELQSGVRIDNTYSNLLRQFNLDGSASKKAKKETALRYGRFSPRPSSILYICLCLGLSIGIGSAFADREIFPSQKPLDQPIRQKAESPQLSEDKAKVEILPQDQKQELIVEKSNRLAHEEKEKDHEKAPSQKASESKSMENHNANMTPSVKEEAKTTSESMSSERSMPNAKKRVPATVAPTDTHAFKTEAGGKLPATAGNNMNNVLLGLLLASVGVVLIRARWTNS